MGLAEKPIHYRIELKETAASTGYFSAVPHDRPTLETGLAYLRRHPNDGFMFAHLRGCVGDMVLRSVLTPLKSDTGSATRSFAPFSGKPLRYTNTCP